MNKNIEKKLALGTVQFGLEYGIANRTGKIPEEEVFEILNFAFEHEIDTLDTACCYGDSEIVIGKFVNAKGIKFKIVSKSSDGERDDLKTVKESLVETLKRLKQDSIYGLLVHKFDNIKKHKKLSAELKYLKQEGLVEKTGFSLYKPEELKYLRDNNIDFDIIQVPYSILDQRFGKYFAVLKGAGVEIHVRSVFLQGLFFLKPEEFTGNIKPAKDIIEKLCRISFEHEIPMHFICLCFAALNSFIDRIIIGVDSLEHLKQNIDFVEYMDKVRGFSAVLKDFSTDDENVLLPYNWK